MTLEHIRPGVLAAHFAAILIVLLAVGRLVPPPAISDREIVELVGQGIVNPGCTDIHCFRILAAALVERFPGPSLPRWRTYAALGSAAGAVMTGRLALALGLSRGAAILAIWLSALTVGSFTTICNPYTSDSLLFFLAPLTTWLLVRGRTGAAMSIASIGIFAKEFAAAPLFVYAGAAAVTRDWARVKRSLAIAVGVTMLWVAYQLFFIAFFGYAYGANPSVDLLSGGYFGFWFRHVGPRTALITLGSAFGTVYLLAAVGLIRAPEFLRALAIGAVLPALAFMYVETPDRALFNFSFVLSPLASSVLVELPRFAGWLFVASYGLANLRLASAWPAIPEARYAFAVTLLLALTAIALAWRTKDHVRPA